VIEFDLGKFRKPEHGLRTSALVMMVLIMTWLTIIVIVSMVMVANLMTE
jgi:hypothetical protein